MHVLSGCHLQRCFRDVGLDLFRVHIVSHPLVEKRLLDGLLLLIQRERKQETVDRGLLKSLLRMLSYLQVREHITKTYDILLQGLYYDGSVSTALCLKIQRSDRVTM